MARGRGRAGSSQSPPLDLCSTGLAKPETLRETGRLVPFRFGINRMNSALAARHAFAIELAREAGALAARLRRSLGVLEAKRPMDYATKADHAVEALIRQRIADRF